MWYSVPKIQSSRGTGPRAGKISKALVRHPCHEAYQSFPTVSLSQGLLLSCMPSQDSKGQGGVPRHHLLPLGTRSPGMGRGNISFIAGEVRLEKGVRGLLPTPVVSRHCRMMVPPSQQHQRKRENEPQRLPALHLRRP